MRIVILKLDKTIEGVRVEVIEFQRDWALKEIFKDSRLSRFFTNLPGHSFRTLFSLTAMYMRYFVTHICVINFYLS